MTTKPTCPTTVHNIPERRAHTWAHLSDSGLLWYINRALLHPLGYALSIDGGAADTDQDALGWCLHSTDGEVISFAPDTDEDAKLAALEQLLATARTHRVSPPDGIPYWPHPLDTTTTPNTTQTPTT